MIFTVVVFVLLAAVIVLVATPVPSVTVENLVVVLAGSVVFVELVTSDDLATVTVGWAAISV